MTVSESVSQTTFSTFNYTQPWRRGGPSAAPAAPRLAAGTTRRARRRRVAPHTHPHHPTTFSFHLPNDAKLWNIKLKNRRGAVRLKFSTKLTGIVMAM